MNPLEKLREEEAAQEAEMLGNQVQPEEETSATEYEEIEQTSEELEAAEFIEEMVTQNAYEDSETEDIEETQPQKKSRTNWKKRFTNYKASTDATIHGLRKELMDVSAQLASLMEENYGLRSTKQEKQGDIFEGAFTEEDIDTFGADGLDIVKKAARVAIEKQVAPLKEELTRAEQARLADVKRRADSDRTQSYREFLGRLESLVPDYEEINMDPKFLTWMDQADTFSGHTKKSLFRQAEASGDVMRVADFFMEFKESRKPKKQPIAKEVERHITPMGSGSGTGPATQQKASDNSYYRKSDIDKFYRDVLKGRYTGQHDVVVATERAIDAAYKANRILHNQ